MDELLIYTIGIIILGILIVYLIKYRKNNQNSTQESSDDSLELNKSNKLDSNGSELLNEEKLDISEITQFVLKNSLGGELTFNRPNELSETKYQELTLSKGGKLASHATQAAMPALEKANTIAEIKKHAPNGLFTSTIDPEKLTKFKNSQEYSTMVHGSNGIKKHKGFLKKDINEIIAKDSLVSSVNAGMQGAAMISGQYYLEEITSQLEGIDSKLEELIEFHHDEKLSILKNAKNRLEEIVKRESVELNDVSEIRNLRNAVSEVYEEYQTRLNRELEKVSKFKSKSPFVEKRVEEYKGEIEKIRFNIQVSYEADRLSIQAELAEISLRMKLDYSDPMLKDLYLQLENNLKDSFSANINDNILDVFRPIDLNADDIVKEGKDLFFIDKDRKKLLKSIYEISNNLEHELDSNEMKDLLKQSIKQRKKSQEILILPSSKTGEQKVYVPIVE